jgi:hypothetical protein
MAAEAKREVAEQRLRQAQEQLGKANDAAAVANSELAELRRSVQVGGGWREVLLPSCPRH